jgi:hypothetical protein
MARYFFHARVTRGASDGQAVGTGSVTGASRTDDYPDNQGIMLASIEEAISYGTRVARELAMEGKWQRYAIVVTDEAGDEIARIPIGQMG